jgi:hypothetical protein
MTHRRSRARTLATAALACLLAAAAACSGVTDGPVHPGSPGGHHVKRHDGFVDAAYSRRRQDDYLRSATKDPVDPGSVIGVIAALERDRRDRRYTYDATKVTRAALQPIFDRIHNFVDTTDFDVLYLMNLWYGYGTSLPADTQAAIRHAFLEFKYWYTEPTPPGVVDNKYYWSENHRLIFHVDEFLAGQAFPTATFLNDGRNGAQHRAEARQRILEWMSEKVRFGFTEWHSDVYYQKDLTPLLSLVEFASDDELRQRASMLLDLFFFDIASHLQKGTFGATHGRSYMKDKSVATDEDTFAVSKLLFNDTRLPYQPGADAGATLFARAHQYRLPEVVRHVAKSRATTVDREHMGVPLDPLAPVTPNPPAPYGYDFADPDNVPFWWERGAQTVWQEVETTIKTLDRYDLWDSDFFSPFKSLRDLVGDDMDLARSLAQSLAPELGFALLTAVDTYTYRAPDVMLSSAQDYRPGMFGEQHHAWQATLDEQALVFTTHPKNEPQVGTQWPDDDGYWTGSGSLPRTAQQGPVAINLYAPQFAPPAAPLDAFSYLPYTHAYFPQERFDEVVSDPAGHWTFGRKGNGYVALWSWRPVHWRTLDPAKYFTHGLQKSFDLVADGGPDDAWVVEVGDARHWKSFDAFRRAIGAAPISATPRPRDGDKYGGFDVDYTSPSQGRLQFGWTGPLHANGKSVALHGTQRYDDPWVRAPFGAQHYRISDGRASLVLDFRTDERRASVDQH